MAKLKETLADSIFLALDAPGVWEALMDRLTEGETVRELAEGFGISYRRLMQAVKRDPDRLAAWKEALSLRSDLDYERALRVLEEADPTSNAAVTKAAKIAEHLERRAAVANPTYQQKPSLQITNLNTGQSFDELLAATLQKIREAQAPPLLPSPVEIVTGETDGPS